MQTKKKWVANIWTQVTSTFQIRVPFNQCRPEEWGLKLAHRRRRPGTGDNGPTLCGLHVSTLRVSSDIRKSFSFATKKWMNADGWISAGVWTFLRVTNWSSATSAAACTTKSATGPALATPRPAILASSGSVRPATRAPGPPRAPRPRPPPPPVRTASSWRHFRPT